MNRDIPAHFDALFDTIDGAVILAQTVWLEHLVCDAKIIAASKEAAELYGYNRPSELEGKYTSELDHPDDYFAIKVMGICRIYQLVPIPNEYDVRIVLPDKSIRYVRKNVRQIEHNDSSYWMTRSVEIEPEEAKMLPDFRSALSSEAFGKWFSAISIAELAKFVHEYVPLRNKMAFKDSLTMPDFHSIINDIQTDSRAVLNDMESNLATATREGVVDIGLGETRRLPDGRFIHRCGNCAETWASQVRNPPQCPRSRDDNRGVKCSVRRWRFATERGRVLASQQILD